MCNRERLRCVPFVVFHFRKDSAAKDGGSDHDRCDLTLFTHRFLPNNTL